MPDDQRHEDTVAFACQVLAVDGVSEQPPPPGTPLARLMAVERRCQVEGLTEQQTAVALSRALAEGL